MKQWTPVFCCALLAACTAPANNAVIDKEETYFEYSEAELADLPKPQEGAEQTTVSQLLAWDARMMDVVRKLRLPPTIAGRLYANVAIAQNDALILGSDARGVTAVGAQVACDTVPGSCSLLLPVIQTSEHGLGVATLVAQKVHDRNVLNDAGKKMPEKPEPGPGIWTDVSATTPDAGSWLPYAKDSIVDFPKPPEYGSAEDGRQVRAVADAVRNVTAWQEERIEHWAGSLGTESPGGIWLSIADEQIIAHGMTSVKDVARLRATLMAGVADSFINCWRTKFTYWTARPSKRDTTIGTIIPLPLFPSYPSGHSTVSATAATILSAAFPDAKDGLWESAREAANTRLWAGIHFPVDNEQGLAMGEIIGSKVLADPRFAL